MKMIDPEHRRNAVTQSIKEFIWYDSDSKNGTNWPMKMAQNWSPFFSGRTLAYEFECLFVYNFVDKHNWK